MSQHSPQSLANHARFDPLYHGLLAFAIVVNLALAIVSLVKVRDFENVWVLVLSLTVVALWLRLRTYPLKVQDRVIRLEERLRLQALAPADWYPQILRLTEGQLIALRFASDEEVVALARQALAENLTRRQIKERIRQWRPDYWRI
ncbi:MAG TPA: DUF6526 family protein [Acidobacteriaceae bacterium]|nr:DUF6526 family protein [Acidobacteriaceae bacterium]